MNVHRHSALIVDDDPMITAITQRALSQHGYETVTAGSGEEALEQLSGRRFDAAVVDLVLPRVSGMEVVAALQRADPSTVVVIVTGYASLQSAIEAVRYGAFDYLRKPIESQQLVDTLQRGLHGRNLIQRSQQLLTEIDETNRRMHRSQATLQERVGKLQERVDTLAELGRRLSQVQSPRAVLHQLLQTAADLADAQAGAILQTDFSLEELRPLSCVGEGSQGLFESGIRLGTGLFGEVAAIAQRRVVNNLLADSQLSEDLLVYHGMRRALIQPLIAAGEPIGIIALFDDQDRAFTKEDQDLVAMLAVQAATILVAAGTAQTPRGTAQSDQLPPEDFIDFGSLLSD